MEIQIQTTETATPEIHVRPLQERDLPTADHIMRLAFGTFIGLPKPTAFMGDAGYVRTRWLSDPTAAFGAEVDGKLIGSNFATNWGSVGFFGPLSIHPEMWDRGVGKRLMEPIMECFAKWGTKQMGLFTFAHSQKHVGLYQRFGFWPQFLTAIMSKPVGQAEYEPEWTKFSEVQESERKEILLLCRELTDTLYEGLEVGLEVLSVATQKLGDTVLLWDKGRLIGLAVCHCGPDTEAGSETCYVKFGAVRPGTTAGQDFNHLLMACEATAAERGLSRLSAGVNTARHEAYHQMLRYGFRTDIQGVAMQKPNESGYNRPGIYIVDDWR